MQELNHSDIGERFVNESLSMTNDELYHHGIKGMKWGVRRFQNKDGTRTPAGLKRYGDKIKEYGEKLKRKAAIRSVNKEAEKIRKKPLSKLTDEELQQRIARAKKENELLNLERPISSMNKEHENLGKKFIVNMGQKVIGPALVDAGKDLLTRYLKDRVGNALGLNGKEVDSAMKALKEEAEKVRAERDISEGRRKIKENDLWMEKQAGKNNSDNKQKNNESKQKSESSNNKPKQNVSAINSPSQKMADEAVKYAPSNSNATSVRELYKRTFPDEYFMTPLSDLEDYRKQTR